MRLIIIFSALMVCTAALAPAAAQSRALGLGQCIALAIKASSEVRYTASLVDYHQAKVKEAFRRFFPRVDLSLAKQPKLDFFGRPIAEEDIYSNTLKVTQPLWTMGNLTSSHRQAKQGLSAARIARQASEREVAKQVVPVYYRLLSARAEYRLRSTVVEKAKVLVAVARRGLRLGQLRREDLLKAQARLLEVAFGAAKARSEESRSLEKLRELIGYGPHRRLILKPQLPTFRPPNDHERLVSLALKRDPAIGRAKAESQYLDLGVRVARSKRNHRFSLVGNFALEGESFPGEEKSYALMLMWEFSFGDSSARAFWERERQFENPTALYFERQNFRRRGLSFSFLDGSSRAANVAEALAHARKAKSILAETERKLVAEIRSLLGEFRRQGSMLRLASKQAALYRERLAVTRAKLRAGQGTAAEVLESRLDLVEAQTRRLQARYERARVLAMLCLLSGHRLTLKDQK